MAEEVFHRIIVLFKRSKLDELKGRGLADSQLKKILTRAHDEHYSSVQKLKKLLKTTGHDIVFSQRGSDPLPRFSSHDLVISLGGDGTFIYASHFIRNSILLGINSAPGSSVGHYCHGSLKDPSFRLPALLQRIRSGELKPRLIERLQIQINGKPRGRGIINDILVCDHNPAVTSHYRLFNGKRSEWQKSSGVWISTASGSTAAYSSAGGRKFPQFSGGKRQFAFLVREPYSNAGLTGGLIRGDAEFGLQSAMEKGRIYLDGGFRTFRLKTDDVLRIGWYPHPLRAILHRAF